MVDALTSMREAHGFNETFVVKLAEPKAEGLNDGMIYPSEQFPVGTAPSVIRSAAADRAPLRGALKVEFRRVGVATLESGPEVLQN